jgi:hypothetical protein
MPCTGHCFDRAPLASPPSYQAGGPRKSPISSSLPPYTYSPLQPGQIRILCLYPSKTFTNDEDNGGQLRGDLLVANLHSLEGVTAECNSKIINYRALSYSWGRPELSEIFICSGKARPISHSNAAALAALRHATKPIYLWIDAICINQEDAQEKSQQVAGMLLIYQKAQSVVAWLGGADDTTLLAITCIQDPNAFRVLPSDFHERRHGASCIDHLTESHKALLPFYERPWLRRTWIRQEVFGARQLVMQCGIYQVSWDKFIQGVKTMAIIRTFLPEQIVISPERAMSLSRLIPEAERNARKSPSGVKIPRDLTEVLLASRPFRVSDERDTFYAILGMCNVATYTNAVTKQPEIQRAAVHVDYSKSVVEVLNDASLCIVGRRGHPKSLIDIWHSYRSSSLYSDGLASWAMDWRLASMYKIHVRATLRHQIWSSPRALYPGPYSWSFRRSEEECEARYFHLSQGWIPLWRAPTAETMQSDREADVHDDWYWPELLQQGRYVLLLKARVINYVAHLTELTCDMGEFMEQFKQSDHDEGIQEEASTDPHCHLSGGLRWTSPYDPKCDSWRLAILGVANDARLSLVPSTATEGDLVVADRGLKSQHVRSPGTQR